MKTTLDRLLDRGDTADLPKSGRPVRVPERKIEAFLEKFLAGNGKPQGQGFRGWKSLRHAFRKSVPLRRMKREMKISFGQLWLRLKRLYKQKYGGPINRITLTWKPKLDDDVKEERLAAAIAWLAQDAKDGWLDYVIWLDEKSEWLTTKGVSHCYAPPGMKSHFVESERGLNKQKEKVKYLAATGALMGALWFGFVAGTTGIKPRHKVRTVPVSRHLHPPTVVALLPCRIQDLHLFRRVFVADAQDAESVTCSCSADALIHLCLLLIVILPVVMLLAIQEHQQASAESSRHPRDVTVEDDDVGAHFAHLCTQTNEGLGIMHERSVLLAGNLHGVDVFEKPLLLGGHCLKGGRLVNLHCDIFERLLVIANATDQCGGMLH